MLRRAALLSLPLAAVFWFAAMGNTAPNCVPVDPEEPACVTLDPSDYGMCLAVLGVVFDGENCVTASGCSCDPDCAYFFDDMESCQEACGLPTYLQEGEVCGNDNSAECAPGLACCYPCGIQGCENRCEPICDDSQPGCSGGCWMYP